MGKEYYVEIVERETSFVIKEIGAMTSREADVVERGININLNHKKYFTLNYKREKKLGAD